jgi:GT2 family glycosyltransferase
MQEIPRIEPQPGNTLVRDIARPIIHVLVVAYASDLLLERCLRPLAGHFPVTVVDNAPNLATRALVSQLGADYIPSEGNIGFAAAVNHGLSCINLATSDVLLLNPDAEIMIDGVESLQIRLHERARCACTAPRQVRPGCREELTVFAPFNSPRAAWFQTLGLQRHRRFRPPAESLVGSILLLNGRTLLDIGGFDERFFLYAEEMDWERRALARGWTLQYCPEVLASHIVGGTEEDQFRSGVRLRSAIEVFIRKWHGRRGWWSFRIAKLVAIATRVALPGYARRRTSLLREGWAWWAGPHRIAMKHGFVPFRCERIPVFNASMGRSAGREWTG